MSKKWVLTIIKNKAIIEKELKEKSIELYKSERQKENWKRMYNNCVDHNIRLVQYVDYLLKDNQRMYSSLNNKEEKNG